MKDVLIIYLGSRGGGVLDTYEIARSLSREGSNRYSVLISENNSFRDKFKYLALANLAVVRTHKPHAFDFVSRTFLQKGVSRVTDVVEMLKPSGILITMQHPWITPVIHVVRKRLKGTRIVYVRHNQRSFEGGNFKVASWLLDQMDRYAVTRSDFVVTLSEHVRESTLKEFNLPPGKVIDIGLGSHSSLCEDWKHSGFLPNGILRVLFFGRITSYKGVDILLSACGSLLSEGLPLSLTIVGEGDLSDEAAKAAKVTGVKVVNHWLPDDRLCQLLSETDVVVLPYTQASQSGPASIATGLGIPVIASDVGGLNEQVVDGVTGMIVKHGSAEALAEAVRRILKNPDLLRTYSEGAKSMTATKLSWHDKTQKIDALFSGNSAVKY